MIRSGLVSTSGCCGALFMLLLGSCSTKVTHLDVDPDYSARQVADSGGAIIGCASSAVDTVDAMELSNHYTPHLQQALVEEREGLTIVQWGEVRRILGDDQLARFLQEVHDHRLLGPAEIDTLATSLGHLVRYATTHRIESDRLYFSDKEETEMKDGKSVETGRVILSTRRAVSVAFNVYDLQLGRSIWEAAISMDRTTERKVASRNTGGGFFGGLVNSAIDAVFGEEELEYPEPASQESMMPEIYASFAHQLLNE